MTLLRDPVGALASLAVLAVIAALAWFAAVEPLREWKMAAMRDRDAAVSEIERLGESIARLSAQRANIDDGGMAHIVWSAAQMGEATAQIQSALSAIASQRGVSLRSVTPTGQRSLSLSEAAGFRLELEASLDQFGGFLTALEYRMPVLVIERATLRRLNRPVSTNPVAGLSLQPLLFAQIDVLAPVSLSTEGG